MELKNLVLNEVPAKKVLYDEDYEIYFDIKFLSKTKLSKMTARHTSIKIDRKTHQPKEDLDTDSLRKEMCETCVKGWYGVTYKWLSTIMPLDKDQIENMDEEVEFSHSALETVIENSYNLDGWIFETVRDCAKLANSQVEEEIKN